MKEFFKILTVAFLAIAIVLTLSLAFAYGLVPKAGMLAFISVILAISSGILYMIADIIAMNKEIKSLQQY